MNSCILMADIIQEPELRYTSDTQTPVTEMVVQFPGLRPEEPPATLKVLGWGNLAQEIQERYHVGDRVILEGRLSMNTIDRPEGFKEKRAELTVQRIHAIGADTPLEGSTAPLTGSVQSSSAYTADRKPSAPIKHAVSEKQVFSQPEPETNFDEIPF